MEPSSGWWQRLQNLGESVEREWNGSVLDHLRGPLELRILHDRIEDEELATKTQRFPSLAQRPARVAGFHDDRGVGDERHEPVSDDEVSAPDRGTGRELREQQMLPANSPLQLPIGRRVARLDRSTEDRDRPS